MQDIDSILKNKLSELGSALSSSAVRQSFLRARIDIEEDNKQHGGSGSEPFWDMVSDERVHVLAVFRPERFRLFAFAAEFVAVLRATDELSLGEVERLEQVLAEKFQADAPLVEVPRSQAEYWLAG